jgi:hypothetical protein
MVYSNIIDIDLNNNFMTKLGYFEQNMLYLAINPNGANRDVCQVYYLCISFKAYRNCDLHRKRLLNSGLIRYVSFSPDVRIIVSEVCGDPKIQ